MRKSRILILLLLFFCGTLFADTIVLMNGQIITGKIENQTATDIFIRTPQGLRRVPKAQIGRITYDEALKKQQELQQQLLIEQQKKLLEEQQKQEQQKKLEEKKEADQKKKVEEEALKQKENPPYLRHDIEVWAGLGAQHLTSGIVGLQQKIASVTNYTNSGFEIRDRRSSDVGGLFNFGVDYNWNRLTLGLNAEIGRNKVSGSAIERKNLNKSLYVLSQDMADFKIDELYKPVDYKSGNLTLGFIVFHSNAIDIQPFVGGRKQQYSVKTDIRGFGNYVDLPMTGYMQSWAESQLSSIGAIGGIELLQPRQANKLRASLTIGYYFGKSNMLTHRTSFLYTDIGDFNATIIGYRSQVSIKGPYSNFRFILPINDRLDTSLGFGYQEYKYAVSDLNIDTVVSERELHNFIYLGLMKDFVTKQTTVKEIIKSVDFRTTYHFDL
ncbi:MAG: hypothetical protein H3C43_06970 [Leptonema sp. (in: Bacteria)]|nr:hypothetical protein [Leptonema sp. (in: bacteria)]